MVTTSSIIASTGGDYTTLTSWQTSRSAVATNGDVEVAVVSGASFNGKLTVGGWNSGVSIIIKAIQPHQGVWSSASGGTVWSCSGQTECLYINGLSTPVTVEDFILKNIHNGRVLYIEGFSGVNLTVNRCLIDSGDTLDTTRFGLRVGATSGIMASATFNSCVFNGPSRSFITAPVIQNIDLKFLRCTFGNSPGGLFGSASSNQILNISGCLISNASGAAGNGWNIGNTATVKTYVTDTILSQLTSPWNLSSIVHCSAATFVSTTPSVGEVGWIDPSNTDRYLRNFNLIDSDNNLAKDFCLSSTLPAYDVLGNSVAGSYADAGAYELSLEEIIELVTLKISRLQLT